MSKPSSRLRRRYYRDSSIRSIQSFSSRRRWTTAVGAAWSTEIFRDCSLVLKCCATGVSILFFAAKRWPFIRSLCLSNVQIKQRGQAPCNTLSPLQSLPNSASWIVWQSPPSKAEFFCKSINRQKKQNQSRIWAKEEHYWLSARFWKKNWKKRKRG